MTRAFAIVLAALVSALLASASAGVDSVTLTRISSDTFGTDVPGAHATEVEPSAVAYGSTIVSAFQVGRNFGGGAAAIGFSTSTDAGRTWQSGLLPALTRWTPTSGPTFLASDPVVAYDAVHGRWLIATGTQVFGQAAWLVSSSADGQMWNAPATALLTSPATVDKDWLTCDNSPASPFRGHCYLAYATWAQSPFSGQVSVAVQTSTDGGATWGPQALVPVDYDVTSDTLSAEPVVRPNGEVVVLFFERTNVVTVRSTDGGVTFGVHEIVSTYSQRAYSFTPDRFRGIPVPTVDVDAGGTIYAAWYDCRFRPGCAANDIVLARSPAPGVWTEPQRVPLGPLTASTDFVLPAIAVQPETRGVGVHLALAYYSLTTPDCTGEGCELTAGLATSLDGGRTWKAASVGSPMKLDWLAPTGIGRMVGDYVAAVFVPGRAVGIFDLAGPPAGPGLFDEATYAASIELPEAPRNTSRPALLGQARVGSTLTCKRGSWSGTPPLRFGYRWLRGSELIPGATTVRKRLTRRDAGALVACRVRVSNAAGAVEATSKPVRVRAPATR